MPVASDTDIEAVDARAQLVIVIKNCLPEINVRLCRLAKAEVKSKWEDGVVRRVCHEDHVRLILATFTEERRIDGQDVE